MSKTTDLNDALRVLRERYQKELPAKLAEIDSLLEVIRAADKPVPDDVQTLHRLVHSLTGSGTTFGLSALSDAARQLEMTIKEVGQGDDIDLPVAVLKRIAEQWVEVRSATARPDALKAGDSVISQPYSTIDAPEKKEGGYILLVEDDVEQARNLQIHLGHFGYSVRVLHEPADLRAVLAESAPAAIIMDVVFSGGALSGPGSIAALPAELRKNIPVIVVSSQGDIASRLGAVRAGADAYFTKPLDIGVLTEKLDTLTSDTPADAIKILIVDDSPSLSSFYATTLQSAGMETRVVTDPMKVLEELADFAPELLLVDMYMPGCNGLELARIIRQQEVYVSTPIVFLSAETDVEKHLEAMQLGADDFLIKPIKPAHLISSVTARVQRYRILRSFMVRDSLTGLLNHTKIKEELETELMRSQRQKSSLSFAMLDIDFFKKVNDTYGHPAGDRVIKSLSRLLQQRLRKSDVIGRYGGEEFAVILKDTDADSAASILDEIRKAFEQVVQHDERGDFYVTISCGVAGYPGFSSAADMNNAADRALYEAKHGGRNRVAVAQVPAGTY
jgi:diguanylate cyclase (GGDEF)-like protein